MKKRKHNRFKVKEETYVALMNDTIKVGQIINISKGGLAFSYIAKDTDIQGWHKMNIFLSGNNFCLKEIPFRAISDFLIENDILFSTVLMRQCGGQFGELTPDQKMQLDYFIENHTTNYVPANH